MIALRPLREEEYAGWDAAHRSLGWSEEPPQMRKQL